MIPPGSPELPMPSSRANWFRAVVSMLALVLFAGVPAVAMAEDIDLGNDQPVVGMVWDDEEGRLFLTDAAAPGAIQIVDEAGAAVGELTFSGQPESVQGLDLVDDTLYIADIGDTSLDRDFVTVFGVPAEDGHQRYRAWDFRYPDGNQDALAFLVSGRGRFYFITGGDNPGIYGAQLDPSRESINTLFRAADAPDGVTDATFLDDGGTMLVRTAEGVVLINAFTWETTDVTTYTESPAGESITQFGDGRMLVGGAGHFRDEPLPSGENVVTPELRPEPTPEPTLEVTDTPTAEPTEPATPDEGDDEEQSNVSRSGTMLAVLGGVGLALVAGVVTFLVRD